MKRPDLLTRALGHPLGCTLGVGFGALLMYTCVDSPDVSGYVGLTGAGLCWGTLASRKRRREWLDWKREWNDASGHVEPRKRHRTWGLLVLGSLLAIASPFLWRDLFPYDRDSVGVALTALLFFGTLMAWTGLGLYAVVTGIVGFARRRGITRRARPYGVRQALPVPAKSAGPGRFTRQLPDYCLSLLSPPGDDPQPHP